VSAFDVENDTFKFALAGGVDDAFFAVDENTGALRFIATPDFESREDADHDNVYSILVSSTDSHGAAAVQAIDIAVTDLRELGRIFNGTSKSDTITGVEGDDIINGQNGGDALNGADGNDVVFGGSAHDTILGGRGEDSLYGDAGNDTIDGGDAADLIDGGAG